MSNPERLRRPLSIAVVTILVTTFVGVAAQPLGLAVQAQSREPTTFRRVAFADPMAGGVEAITLLVPSGWQAEGGVVWLPSWSRAAHLGTHVIDPVGGITIDWLPIQDFIWFEAPAGSDAPVGGNYQGKAYVPPIMDPAEFVTRSWMPGVLSHLRDATLVEQRQVPEVADEFVRGFGGPAKASGHVLRYAFDHDGRPWDQDVSFALLHSDANGVISWYVNFAYTVAGPRGSLDRDRGLISTVVASRTTTAEWEGIHRLVQQLFYQGIEQQMVDTVRFGEALARYRAEIQALQAQVTAERQASQDRIAQFRRDILGGVENYIDPYSGGIVQLPVGWVQYWVNPRGEYMTVDDPTFDPNQSGDQGWQLLRPQDP